MSVRRSGRTGGRGVQAEPAYMLHRYDWSESSLILELFTRHHGRVAVAARGVRRPTSGFRAVLLPFQPLLVSFGPEAEVRTLKGAEWAGGYVMPTGAPLLVGYYLNELVLKLVARDDPQTLVFDAYARTLAFVAVQGNDPAVETMLRAFELLLLRELGVLPALDRQTLTQAVVDDRTAYALDPESGLVAADRASARRGAISGADWKSLATALSSADVLQALPVAVGPLSAELKLPLRTLLQYHAGTEVLRTRQLMLSLQRPRA